MAGTNSGRNCLAGVQRSYPVARRSLYILSPFSKGSCEKMGMHGVKGTPPPMIRKVLPPLWRPGPPTRRFFHISGTCCGLRKDHLPQKTRRPIRLRFLGSAGLAGILPSKSSSQWPALPYTWHDGAKNPGRICFKVTEGSNPKIPQKCYLPP
jgi:hypothetical protein